MKVYFYNLGYNNRGFRTYKLFLTYNFTTVPILSDFEKDVISSVDLIEVDNKDIQIKFHVITDRVRLASFTIIELYKFTYYREDFSFELDNYVLQALEDFCSSLDKNLASIYLLSQSGTRPLTKKVKEVVENVYVEVKNRIVNKSVL